VEWTRRSRLLRLVLRIYRERLTWRGRYLLWVTVVFAVLGLDTLRSQVVLLFAGTAALFLVALPFSFTRAPKLAFEWPFPTRTTSGALLPLTARLQSLAGSLPDVWVSFGAGGLDEGSPACSPRDVQLAVGDGEPSEVRITVTAPRRGRFVVRGPRARRTDPAGLLGGRPFRLPDRTITVYPRFWHMTDFEVPVGRRFHPGGIPLSSNIGESIEFVGTREFRPGDAVRNIHFRSWARRGVPVVREHQEEYFCRIAIILDTFVPKGRVPNDHDRFEAAISLTASIADFFSRSENIVDVLAAGPDLYEVSAGRSLAYLENILDVLACVDPCFEPPFQTIGPTLFEKLGQLSTVIAVLLDWDQGRQDFLRRIVSLGTAVRAIVVNDAPTDPTWSHFNEGLSTAEVMGPSAVEAALASGKA
jgi:uncharacterized protein (DUF58 family)